jgi:hypothetical protein
MPNNDFSIKRLHLFGGRLAISLVRNTAIPRKVHARFFKYEKGLGYFVTLRVGSIFLNVDWV